MPETCQTNPAVRNLLVRYRELGTDPLDVTDHDYEAIEKHLPHCESCRRILLDCLFKKYAARRSDAIACARKARTKIH